MTDKPISGAAAALALLLAACAGDTPEQRLRDTIAAMEEAVEAKAPGDFIDHVSDDFSGDRGNFDRQSLRGFLAAQMMRKEAIGVTLGPLDVKVMGDRAIVRVDALVTGGGGVIPDSGEHLDIESGWRLVDGEWQCYSAELK
jgi:hypothetical protein